MSNLSTFKSQYDFVLNLFTSFGYFHSDKENEKVLREMFLALKPGGKAAINLIDRDWIMGIYQPVRWSVDGGIMTIEASRYDKKTHYNESQMVMIDRRKAKPTLLHQHYHRVRLYSKSEMVSLMRRVGFRNVRIFGDFAGSKFKKNASTHPIYIGQK
jgi:SAM-dependent methyltransferase